MSPIRWTVPGLLAAFITASILSADPAAPTAPAPPAPTAIASCNVCHYGAKDDAGKTLNHMKRYIDPEFGFESDKYIRLDECKIWETHDPHSLALKALNPEVMAKLHPPEQNIAKIMTDNYEALDKRNGKAFRPLNQRTECLTCHAIDNKPAVPLAEKKYEDFACAESDGLNCFACHGRGTWEGTHFASPAFRSLAPDKKDGLKNLRDPHAKAMQCASCHVGSAAEGKVVTHEMYAAGHPPLPPFELLAFTNGQPAHWKKPSDLKYYDSLNPEQAKNLSYRKAEEAKGYAARHIAMGALASLEREAELLAAESTHGQPFDYARFDCYACHHNLVPASDRQKRGYDGAPGRPPLKAWNFSLVDAIVEHALQMDNTDVKKSAEGYQDLKTAIKKAALDKPFADPEAMKAAAKAMADWTKSFAAKLGESDCYTPPQAENLLKVLEKQLKDPKNLYDSESQLALLWAYKSLSGELNNAKDWAKLDPVLPTDVRTPAEREAKSPVYAGDIARRRMEIFNAYRAGKFKEAFGIKE